MDKMYIDIKGKKVHASDAVRNWRNGSYTLRKAQRLEDIAFDVRLEKEQGRRGNESI